MIASLLTILMLVALPGNHQLNSPRIHQFAWEAHPGLPPVAKGDGTRPAWGPLVPRTNTALNRRVVGYSVAGSGYRGVSDAFLHYDLLTDIICFGTQMNADGSMTYYSNFPATWVNNGTIAHAKKNGVKLHWSVDQGGADIMHQILTTSATVSINNMITKMESVSGIMDGLHIDYEGASYSDKALLTSYLCRLADSCHAHGWELSIATPPDDWTGCWNFPVLSDSLDWIAAMFYVSSDGSLIYPSCPYGNGHYNEYFQFWANHYINDPYYVPARNKNKLMAMLPYYVGEWTTSDSTLEATATGGFQELWYNEAIKASQIHSRRWDSSWQSPNYFYKSGSTWYQGWYDDDSSFNLKYKYLDSLGYGGTGLFTLGMDSDRIEQWGLLRESFNLPQASFKNGNCETWIVDTAKVPSDTNHRATGWLCGRKTRVKQASTNTHSGSYAIKQIPDSIGDPWPARSILFQDVNVSPGLTYQLSGYARKMDEVGNQMELQIAWYNSSHNVLRTDTSAILTTDGTGYVSLTTGQKTAPTNTTFARLTLYILGYGSYDQWDDMTFTTVSSGGEEGTKGFNGLKVNPNPFVFFARVPGHEGETFALYDMACRKVGTYRGDKIGADLAPGVYFVRRAGPDPTVVKIVKVR